jgi:hypothetical protein
MVVVLVVVEEHTKRLWQPGAKGGGIYGVGLADMDAARNGYQRSTGFPVLEFKRNCSMTFDVYGIETFPTKKQKLNQAPLRGVALDA